MSALYISTLRMMRQFTNLLLLHDINTKSYKALKRHYYEKGIATHRHSKKRGLPENSLVRVDSE